ncbi:hypothetical protein AVM02_09500 [Brucella anthropi]
MTFNGGMLQILDTAMTSTSRAIQIGDVGGGFDIADKDNIFTLSQSISGTGTFTKSGAGVLVLSGNSGGFTGLTSVSAGQLRLDSGATLGGNVSVASGTAFGGGGTVGGVATVSSGAVLFAQSGAPLEFDGGLSFQTGSTLEVTLNEEPSTKPVITVKGDLALNGTLNITDQSTTGDAGVYRIIDYTGALTVNSMKIGNVPGIDPNNYSLQVVQNPGGLGGNVNVEKNDGMAFYYWDGGDSSKYGNGQIDGGNGTWDASTTAWTNIDGVKNASWTDHGFAVFMGTGGVVTLANGYTPEVDGMQFAADKYRIEGGAIDLANEDIPVINVGDRSAGGASYTATIAATLTDKAGDENGFEKIGYGTLVLAGDNTYKGTTTVAEGTLQLGEGGTTGSIRPDSEIVLTNTRYDRGRLVINHSDTFTLGNEITGVGQVFQSGAGTTIFSGNNSFSGGLIVEKGVAQAGIATNAFGTGYLSIDSGAVADLNGFDTTVNGLLSSNPKEGSFDGEIRLGSGRLTVNQGFESEFSGAISGSGGMTLSKDSTAPLTLSGVNTYSGATIVEGGTLIQGASGGFSGASAFTVNEGTNLRLGGFNTNMSSLTNSGTVDFGGKGGATLTIAGDYVGNNGTIAITSNLNDDSSKTDKLLIEGNTSGSTTLDVTNRTGLGAATTNGIEIIDVKGSSNGDFVLKSDYQTPDGKNAIMTSSAYAYTLQKNSKADPNDGNWYLVSQYTGPNPVDPGNPTDPTNPPGLYSAAAPIYEAYKSSMQTLNRLPTLQQRVGDRYFDDVSAIVRLAGEGGEPATIANWGRVEGAHDRLRADTTAGRVNQNINTYQLQTGIDGEFYEDANGRLIGGLTGQYGQASSNITDFYGGTINTQGWGFGGTLTWYDNDGFYADGQVQISSYTTDLYSKNLNKQLAEGNKGTGYAASIEVGQRYILDDNWSVTPQAQLVWSSVIFDTFKDIYGARISDQGGESLLGRFGFMAKYSDSWLGSDGLPVDANMYSTANFYQEFLGGTRIDYGGTVFDNASDDLWAGIGVGGSYRWANKKYTLYGEGSVNSSINHIAESYYFKATIGFQVKL